MCIPALSDNRRGSPIAAWRAGAEGVVGESAGGRGTPVQPLRCILEEVDQLVKRAPQVLRPAAELQVQEGSRLACQAGAAPNALPHSNLFTWARFISPGAFPISSDVAMLVCLC